MCSKHETAKSEAEVPLEVGDPVASGKSKCEDTYSSVPLGPFALPAGCGAPMNSKSNAKHLQLTTHSG